MTLEELEAEYGIKEPYGSTQDRLDKIATKMLLADRKERIGANHENDWLSPNQLKHRQKQEMLVSDHLPGSRYDSEDAESFLDQQEIAFVTLGARDPKTGQLVDKTVKVYRGEPITVEECIEDDCEEEPKLHDRCPRHAAQWATKKRGIVNGQRRPKCLVDTCPEAAEKIGLCGRHYQHKRIGIPLNGARRKLEKLDDECHAEDCEGEPWARNLCWNHYQKWRRTREGGPRCKEMNCDDPVTALGLCSKHYQRQRRKRANGQDNTNQHHNRGRSRASQQEIPAA